MAPLPLEGGSSAAPGGAVKPSCCLAPPAGSARSRSARSLPTRVGPARTAGPRRRLVGGIAERWVRCRDARGGAGVRGLKALYVVAAVTMAGVSSVFALLAALDDRYGLSSAGLGLVAGSAFAAALVAQVGLSRYADRGYGARLLRGGVVACSAGLLWFAAGTELWQFVCARALLGAGVGMIIPAARRAIVLQSGDRQGEALGVFYAAYISGFLFGPPVAALLASIADVRLPFLVLGVAVACTLVPLRHVEMPEGAPAEAGAEVITDKRVMRRLLRDRRVLAAVLVNVSFRYSIGVFEPLWAVHLDDLGASTVVIGLSLTAFTAPMLLIAKRAGRLSDRHGARLASLAAAAATVPLMASLGWIRSVPVLFLMTIPYGISEAIESPGAQAALADAAPRSDAAAAQGLGEAAGSVAAAVGALTAAPMFGWLGAGPTWLFSALVMATLLSISAWLDWPTHRARAVVVTPVAVPAPAPGGPAVAFAAAAADDGGGDGEAGAPG